MMTELLKKLACFGIFLAQVLSAGSFDAAALKNWRVEAKSGSVTVSENSAGGITVAGEKTGQKTVFAKLMVKLPEDMDCRDLTAVVVSGRASQPVLLNFDLSGAGKIYLFSDWNRSQKLSNVKSTIRFEKKDIVFKNRESAANCRQLGIGLGLWEFDAANTGYTIEIESVLLVTASACYVLPRPAAAVAIDGEYRKDWGFEDVLYNWTPPDYIKLDLPGNVVSGQAKWSGPATLSGDFAMMYDADNLYFLAIVADAAPGSGVSVQPYQNDSVELFFAPGASDKDFERNTPLATAGLQVVFDCGSGEGKATVYGGKTGAVRSVVSRKNISVGDRPVPGYVLEAAIPFSLFSDFRPEKGISAGYSIKLNDSDGISLLLTGKNAQPHLSVADYRQAWFEFVGAPKTGEFHFAGPAANLMWPLSLREPGRIWDKLEMRQESATVTRAYLNGIWAIQKVNGNTDSPRPDAWSYSIAPMGISWAQPYFMPDPKQPERLRFDGNFGHVGGMSGEFFWYERTFDTDPAWQGKSLTLNFDHVEWEAEVYFNGVYLGVAGPGRTVFAVGGALRSDAANRVDFRLFTKVQKSLMIGRECGVSGDIYLEISPAPAAIGDIRVTEASGINGTFEFDVELDKAPADYAVGGRLLCRGKEVAELDKQPVSSHVALTGKLPDFRPWSPEQPELYQAAVRLFDGAGNLREERIVTFGFRTFETSSDGKFLLNGNIFRFRAADPAAGVPGIISPVELAALKKYGFNSFYAHGSGRGNLNTLYELADRYGFVMLAPVNRAYSDRETADLIRTIRNHPSIVGYISDCYGQLSHNGRIHDPYFDDDDYLPDNNEAQKIFAHMKARDAMFRRLDPTRRYIAQGTGNWPGFMRQTHEYPTNALNLTDRRYYHLPWSLRKNPKLPLQLFEAGTVNLLAMDTLQPEQLYPVTEKRTMVPRIVIREAAAHYFGDAAYRDWLQYQALLHRVGLRNFRFHGVDGYMAWDVNDYYLNPIEEAPLTLTDNRSLAASYYVRPLIETAEDNWMRVNSWYYRLRAQPRESWPDQYGLGKIEPRRNHFTAIYENENQPVFAAVTGGEGHNYYAGENVIKSVSMVNDTAKTFLFRGTVRLQLNGSIDMVAAVEKQLTPGAVETQQFTFLLPGVTAKTAAVLNLEYQTPDGAVKHDEFALTVFPKSAYGPVRLDDKQHMGVAAGPGAPLSAGLGIRGIPVDLHQVVPAGVTVLIVETGALASDINPAVLRNFVDAGGTAVILAQDANSLYSYRARERWLEYGFIAANNHPLVAGLEDRDLANWRGGSQQLPDGKRPGQAYWNTQSTALETPRITNNNVIAGYVLPNPVFGRFVPIVTGGYDRDDAILLEARSGKGRVIFCQADIAGRYGIDPAATKLANNLFTYALTPVADAVAAGVAYSGGPEGKKWLDLLGVPVNPDSPVMVIGENGSYSGKHSKAIYLPGAQWLPQIKSESVYLQDRMEPYYWNGGFGQFELMKSILPGTDFLPDDKWYFTGISAADLYLFENPKVTVFAPLPGAWRSEKGSLMAVEQNGIVHLLTGFDPALVKDPENLRKLARIWSVLLYNLNVDTGARISWSIPETDLSDRNWRFLTDPDGKGEATGFAAKNTGGKVPQSIKIGKIWEEQGVNEPNPAIASPTGSAYDGFAWYFLDFELTQVPSSPVWLHLGGVRDINTSKREENQTAVYLNNIPQDAPVRCYNAQEGGRGGRLWQLKPDCLKPGKNFLAIRVYNDIGAGGIHRKPVRLETAGRNRDLLFDDLFQPSKYSNYFFWSW